MKSDFAVIKQQLPGICQIASDFYMRPKRVGSRYFVKSPASNDRNWSLCLFPSTGTFCDFANGHKSGDSIGFLAYLKNITNWEALKTLKDFYRLPDSIGEGKEAIRKKIKLQQEKERLSKERKREFEDALNACICDLKHDEDIYRAGINGGAFEPFSRPWCHCVDRLNQTTYKLDILCGVGTEYLRMKPDVDRGISSDYPRWLHDCLGVLSDGDYFLATDAEKEEIKAQMAFESIRSPEQNREFSINWWKRAANE